MELLKSFSKKEFKVVRTLIERQLEQYRIFKSLITLYTDDTSLTYSSPLQLRECQNFCNKIEQAVNELPQPEKFLIEERYLHLESEYRKDYDMYSHIFEPHISHMTYMKIRKRAMCNLAIILNIDCGVNLMKLIR